MYFPLSNPKDIHNSLTAPHMSFNYRLRQSCSLCLSFILHFWCVTDTEFVYISLTLFPFLFESLSFFIYFFVFTYSHLNDSQQVWPPSVTQNTKRTIVSVWIKCIHLRRCFPEWCATHFSYLFRGGVLSSSIPEENEGVPSEWHKLETNWGQNQ